MPPTFTPICTGVRLETNVPLPNCPLLLAPQHLMTLPVRTAHVSASPATTPITPVRFGCTGVRRLVSVPSPSWPYELFPQHRKVPSARSTQVWFFPRAMEG